MLTRIRNAHRALLPAVDVPHSKMKESIAGILKREGYIADFAIEGQEGLCRFGQAAARRQPGAAGEPLLHERAPPRLSAQVRLLPHDLRVWPRTSRGGCRVGNWGVLRPQDSDLGQ